MSEAKTNLSASDIGSAYYIGKPVISDILSVKNLMRKLKVLGLSRRERIEDIRNVKTK